MTKAQESQTYGKMLGQVESIIQEMNQGEMDLDQMVEKVEVGYDLIKNMRDRLNTTKEKMEKLRESFEEA